MSARIPKLCQCHWCRDQRKRERGYYDNKLLPDQHPPRLERGAKYQFGKITDEEIPNQEASPEGKKLQLRQKEIERFLKQKNY